MSNEEWFKGMSPDDFDGKHVRLRMKDGSIIEGRLNDECTNVTIGSGNSRITVFECKGTVLGPYLLSDGIESISLLWDERDWEQVPIDDAEEGDVLVIGDSKNEIFEVHGEKSSDRYWTINNDEGSSITPDMVSYVLRKKPKLPTEPGYYQGDDGTLLIRLDCSQGNWMFVSVGFTGSGAYVGDEVARKYLPLTPVHFVDGKEQTNE